MSGFLVIDTETTGLFDFAQPADAPGQPRMASCAMIAVGSALDVERMGLWLVWPDGWSMPPEASAINGLTDERLTAEGHPVGHVLAQYQRGLDEQRTVVSYNVQYDTKILRGEMRRFGLPDRYDTTRTLCVMKAMTEQCCIPKASGRGHKWPRLSEAYRHCFGRELEGAHGALEDARACLDVLKWLRERGDMPLAD